VAVRASAGRGLEVAAAGHLIFAAPGATLGQPEIKLAVFAPAASCLLPERIGQSRARISSSRARHRGGEAHRIGLVDALADDPSQAALAYFEEHLQSKAPVPSGSPCAPPVSTSLRGSAGSSPRSNGCTSKS